MTTTTPEQACPPDHHHGRTVTCYNKHSCRCAPCTNKHAAAQRDRRRAKAYGRYQPTHLPARGAQRRLQALIRQGWSQKKLAARLGIDPQRVREMLQERMITRVWHDRVDELFGQLWDKVPAHTEHRDLIAYNRTVRYAIARGWVLPLEWDDIDNDDGPATADEPSADVDPAVVALAITGAPLSLTPAQREAAVVALHAQRMSDIDIAERLRCDKRTVFRIRHDRLNLPAVAGNNAAA